MASLPIARVTFRHFTLVAIAGLLALAFLVAFTTNVDADTRCECTDYRSWTVTGDCGDSPCSDFERPKELFWQEVDCDSPYVCRSGSGPLGCFGYTSCGGITSDPDGEIPLGEPGQAALIACVMDAVPVTAGNTDVNAAVSVNPSLALHWFG